KEITFDYITKLLMLTKPLFNAKYDAIWVVVDRLTKYAYFIPYKERSTAMELQYAFLRNIVANYGLPKKIIMDRGVTFTSKYWKTLTSSLGIKHAFSMAYHLQTNSQTGRTNQTLEQYLRAHI